MKVIYAQEKINIEGKSVFLAGPTPRDKNIKSWRKDVLAYFEHRGFDGTVLVPEFENEVAGRFAYERQIDWEEAALEKADLIIFYIPRDVKTLPGFTTNIELGMWFEREPGKIRLAIPPEAQKCDYIRYVADKKYINIYDNYQELVIETIRDLELMPEKRVNPFM